MPQKKKKFTAGEGALYYSRAQAIRKLQVSLKSFRKLCIYKGIYPREPRNRKKAQHGATDKRTLYHKKDIRFLMHEPLLWKIWAYKAYCKKKAKARAKKERDQLKRLQDNKPVYKLDHIVKERYPNFMSAVRDLDDCLTMCFLFSHFPMMAKVTASLSRLCRRLTIEFMHYCIEAKALRKVFISIKGFYYQASIKGETVTWIVPHHFGFQPQKTKDVDFSVMTEFVQFYSTLLGFVNYRMYTDENLYYPPAIPQCLQSELERELVDEAHYVSERVAALNYSLVRSNPVVANNAEDEVKLDEFPDFENTEEVEKQRREQESESRLKGLFKGMKFFLNREVPREPLTFVIRCLGGEVSWDKLLFVGSKYDETDETITHQVVDRPVLEKQYLSRYYIQPQWVFDCCNARLLLAVEDYFPGVILPPHISPFVDERPGDYVPPEKRDLLKMLKTGQPIEKINGSTEEGNVFESEESEPEDLPVPKKTKTKAEKEIKEFGPDAYDKEKDRLEKLARMKAESGQPQKLNKWIREQREGKEHAGLCKLMVSNKHRKLYKSMARHKARRQKEARLLNRKRKEIEEVAKVEEREGRRKRNPN